MNDLKKIVATLCMLSICFVSPSISVFASESTITSGYPDNKDWDENEKEIFYGWIEDVYYYIDKVRGYAKAMEGRMPGDAFLIPSTVTLEDKEYPITQYSTIVPDYISDRQPREYQKIVFPDTIENILLKQKDFPNLKSFNIPDNANTLQLKVDFREVKVDISENHPKFIVKNHALYLRKHPTVLYEPLDIPENYTVNAGTTEVQGFYQNYYVKKVTLPASVKKCSSFFDCRELTSVDLSKTQIDALGSFENCKKLTSVKLPLNANIKKIWKHNFHECKKLKSITLPSKVTRISFMAFEECESLQSAKLSKDLKVIEGRAFHKTALKEITLPSKVRQVEYAAFKSCKNLSKVTLETTKKVPAFEKKVFTNTKSGLPFYVKNKTVAKSLKKALKGTGVKKAKIYVGKTLIYQNVQ